MTPQPIYTAEDLSEPAYHLRYTWSGWPSSASFPGPLNDEAQAQLDSTWKGDGMRRLETNWNPNIIQFTFTVKPQLSPVLFAARVKGRLQHALRNAGTPVKFSRKLAVRTIGDNTTAEVEAYIKRQVAKEPLADERFKHFLEEFTVVNSDVDLSQPSASGSGRYWYNLHLVLVVRQRVRFADRESLAVMRDQSLKIAEKKGYAISTLSVMPDHIHMALRGNIESSPEEIALTFMNNLAFALGQTPVWQTSYYMGTFSEYNMNAVRPRFKSVEMNSRDTIKEDAQDSSSGQ